MCIKLLYHEVQRSSGAELKLLVFKFSKLFLFSRIDYLHLCGFWCDNGTPSNPYDDFWVGGDYHLQSTSPCIDAGTSNNVPETDVEGNARYDDPNTMNIGGGTYPYYDMGAFECQGYKNVPTLAEWP